MALPSSFVDSSKLQDPLEFQIGEYKTRVLFPSDAESLLRGPDNLKVLTVFDSNTFGLLGAGSGPSMVLPPGEEYKTMDSVLDILSEAIERGLARDGLFLGVGGGVICDMTAFAASLYMRGCRVILVPTTLLAMVDASLGGKTGIDFRGYKNMAGTFFPAEELRIYPEILLSLSEKEFRNGLAELIKHAFLVKSELLEFLKVHKKEILERRPAVLTRIIRDSIRVKGDFVERDFKEQGERAFLNFGHTFGHALESVSDFSGWSHGEAVAWGMDKALKAGILMGETDREYGESVASLLLDYGFCLEASLPDPEKLIDAMDKDKKKKSGKVRFVLQHRWGETFQKEIPREILKAVLS